RLGFLHYASARLEYTALPIRLVADHALDGDAAEVLPPRDAHAFEAALQLLFEARVEIGHGGKIEREVIRRTRHRTFYAHRRCCQNRPDGHAVWRRAQPHYIAKAVRVPQRSAEIGAIRNRQHVGRKRDSGSAAAAAAGLRAIERIQRRAENLVVGLRPGAELWGICFAEQYGAGRPHALHEQRIVAGYEVLEDR